ncbi:adenosinetriphosphatase [Plasmodium inui San Antonio 1]|uniref:ATP-dependent RNA helicase n=1 Tax=Plasmodium inui San Antonio 1 TaxID=1237626 RepID=W7ARR2_9APIC|nr:adenosinetriphosphatase [Plasmodium inui San Antonio 1]EUD68166.1 adenosinetriphosphatase [Plasmodium inui San Antonio 1]
MFFAPSVIVFFLPSILLNLVSTFHLSKVVSTSFLSRKGTLRNVNSGEEQIILCRNLQRHYNNVHSQTVEHFLCKNEKIDGQNAWTCFFKKDQTFSKLLVHPTLVEELKKNNIIIPSLIQFDLLQYYNKYFPMLRNVIIGAENGIGKTLSYIIFVLNHILMHSSRDNRVFVLIFQYSGLLTRQCLQVVRRLSRNVKVKCATLNPTPLTPVNLNPDRSLILITSPVRFATYMKKNEDALTPFLKNLDFLIMDEVDVMFEDPFVKHVKALYEQMSKVANMKYISIVTSSTLPNKGKKSVYQNINKYVTDAVLIKTNYLHNVHPLVNYHFVNLPTYTISEKIKAIKRIMSKENYKKTLIFCNTVTSCNNAFSQLSSLFEDIYLFNSSLKKEDQFAILGMFKNSERCILVTTDIIHRGVDIKGITHLFHLDAPTNIVVYTHRNGRISRGASTGDIYLFNDSDNLVTKKIYQLHKKNVKFEDIFSRKRSLRKNYKRDLKNSKHGEGKAGQSSQSST